MIIKYVIRNTYMYVTIMNDIMASKDIPFPFPVPSNYLNYILSAMVVRILVSIHREITRLTSKPHAYTYYNDKVNII